MILEKLPLEKLILQVPVLEILILEILILEMLVLEICCRKVVRRQTRVRAEPPCCFADYVTDYALAPQPLLPGK